MLKSKSAISKVALRTRKIYDRNCTIARLKSKCLREGGKVACSVFIPHSTTKQLTFQSVVAQGVSGPVTGAPPCDGTSDPCGCMHAEAHAMLCTAAAQAYSFTLFAVINRAPCSKCAALMIETRKIECVICPSPEKGEAGIELLVKCGVRVVNSELLYWISKYGPREVGRVLLGSEGVRYDL